MYFISDPAARQNISHHPRALQEIPPLKMKDEEPKDKQMLSHVAPSKKKKGVLHFLTLSKGSDLNVVHSSRRGRRSLERCRGLIQAEEEGKVLAFQIWAPSYCSTMGIGKATAMRVPGNNEAWSKMDNSDGMIPLPRPGSETDYSRDRMPTQWAVLWLQAPALGLRGLRTPALPVIYRETKKKPFHTWVPTSPK